MVVNVRPLKRLKRTVTAELPDFLSFPRAAPGSQPFRRSVSSFLARHARLTSSPSLFPSLMAWQITFRVGDSDVGRPDACPTVVTLDIVEEDVPRSRSIYCDQCRVVGWSGHPVCRKRYHFIIRSESNNFNGYQKACSSCGNMLQLSETRCKCCSYAITDDDLGDWGDIQLQDSTHLLHGVVHSNGYGHLLTVNGREGGSKSLCGSEIMNFWDRLCRVLSVRKVSVLDASRKYGMEYRLLHAITKGHSWYGNWGYQFGNGCYALTQEAYRRALDTLCSSPLSIILHQGCKQRSHLQDLISFYQFLSDAELVTVKDLFSFLLNLISRKDEPWTNRKLNKHESSGGKILVAWRRNDIEYVETAMIKILEATRGDCWVSKRSLKSALCKAASAELLDCCLKHLEGKLTANGMIVEVRCNPCTRAVEYRLQPLKDANLGSESNFLSREQIIDDLRYLYNCILRPDAATGHKPQMIWQSLIDSATKLLDCKQFIKDYEFEQRSLEGPNAVHVWCQAVLTDQAKDDSDIPPELIVFPPNATIADLKMEAAKAFEEVYVMFKRFEVTQLQDFDSIDDSITLNLLIGSRGSIRIRGKRTARYGLNRFRMERGIEEWRVDCVCGAKDDDGERMLACDTCGVWQHTRCSGIDSCDEIPSKFICRRCVVRKESEETLVPIKETVTIDSDPPRRRICRGDAVTDIPRVGSHLSFHCGVH